MHLTTFCSHKMFYLFFFIRTSGTKMNVSKDEQTRSSTLAPLDILRHVFTKKKFPRFLLTAVFILFYSYPIYCQTKHHLKMGWRNIYPRF